VRRREFIAGLAGAAAWPVVARAQRPNRVSRIGILALAPADSPNHAAFYQGLRDLGYIEGQNLLMNTVDTAADGSALPVSRRNL
jgi:putative ABC transport system substrate-binding protein